MSNARFLYDNLITAESMIAVSSLRTGFLSGAIKDGTGSGVLNPSGQFSGTTDIEYTVEIDSVAGGAEVGQSTFKWSDGGGTWDATSVTTSTSPISLNNGISIAFASGSGNDFVLTDKWYFKGVNRFNAGKLIDLDRDSRYRALTLESPNAITIDLGSAQAVQALALFDHNFSSGVTLILKGNTADSWGSPAFSEAVIYNALKILHYLSSTQTYRYWRIEITNTSNPDNYIEVGELFLGAYLELSKNFDQGYSKDTNTIVKTNRNNFGVNKNKFFNTQIVFSLEYVHSPDADITSLESMLSAIISKSAQTIQPIFFNEDSANPNDTWIVEFSEIPKTRPYKGKNHFTIDLIELLRSAV